MDKVRHWKLFWSTISVRFICQRWYFNPQCTTAQAIKCPVSVTVLVNWQKYTVAMCWHINQVFWRSFWGEGGPFWLHKETLTLKGPAT